MSSIVGSANVDSDLVLSSEDFPNLYRSASLASQRAQRAFFRALACSLLFLVVAAALSVINPLSSWGAFLQAIILLASLGLTLYLSFIQPQRKWYSARALAESVKTITWRFVVRAEPYDGQLQLAKANFVNNLRKLLEDNAALKDVIPIMSGEEVTDKMAKVRALPLLRRRKVYEKHRIDNQRSWYRNRAQENDRNSRIWYGLVVGCHAAAIAAALARIAYPTISYWPTDIFVTAAASVMAWLQTNRFQELAASYSLTAHDISLLKEQLSNATTERKFSDFVGDAENAFSREHTQWRARRDVE